MKNNVKFFNSMKKVLYYMFIGAIWSLSNVGYVKYFGSFFAFFTLSFFVYSIYKENFKNGIVYSIIFGFTAYIVHFWWMSIPMVIVMGSDLFPSYISAIAMAIGIIITLSISFFQGLYYTILFYLSKKLSFNNKIIYYLLFIIFGTALDYFYPKIWADYLGYSQFNNSLLMQSVDLLGISFITLLVLTFNVTFASFIDVFINKKQLIIPVISLTCLLFIVAFLNLYGSKRITHFNLLEKTVEKVKIGIVQGNNSGLDKRSSDRSTLMIDTYNELSNTILNQYPSLIVWPESSVPMWFSESNKSFGNIRRFSRVPLLFGTHFRKNTEENYNIYNTLILTDDNGYISDMYNKNKLLPFTEEMPIDFLDFIMPILGLKEFSRGEGPKIVSSGIINAAVNICYEAIIPDYIRKSMKYNGKEANVIINATNDSWFGKTIEPEMHLRISSVRSIENRKYLVRSTCTGYSVVVNAVGDILYRSDLYTKEAHVHEIPLLEEVSFYRKGGYLFVYIVGLVSIFYILISLMFIRRTKILNDNIIQEIDRKKKLNSVWNS